MVDQVALLEDGTGNVHLKNLSLTPVQSEEDALNALFLGDTNRMIAETPMNQASTRSHCIFTIHVTVREAGSAVFRKGKLHLVDLAGSGAVPHCACVPARSSTRVRVWLIFGRPRVGRLLQSGSRNPTWTACC
jgi:hypothetical protein